MEFSDQVMRGFLVIECFLMSLARRAEAIVLLILVSIGSMCALAPAAVAAERLGIVLLHGKEGLPEGLQVLAQAFEAAGYSVERPEMCWSRRRIYDLSYLDCLGDVDEAASRLKSGGATAIVIVGVGFGGNAALAYGSRREDVRGVMAFGPAPPIEFLSRQPAIAKSLAEAKAMIASGRGDQRAVFADVMRGRSFEVETTANIYLSFFAPDSPGVMPENSSRLKAPLLIVSGTFDLTQRSIPYVFARAPSGPFNWHLTVHGDQRDAVTKGRDAALTWLKLLAEGKPAQD